MLKMGFAIRKFDKHNSYKAYLFYHQTFELHREWGTNKKKYRSIVLRNIVLRRNIKVLLRASKNWKLMSEKKIFGRFVGCYCPLNDLPYEQSFL